MIPNQASGTTYTGLRSDWIFIIGGPGYNSKFCILFRDTKIWYYSYSSSNAFVGQDDDGEDMYDVFYYGYSNTASSTKKYGIEFLTETSFKASCKGSGYLRVYYIG